MSKSLKFFLYFLFTHHQIVPDSFLDAVLIDIHQIATALCHRNRQTNKVTSSYHKRLCYFISDLYKETLNYISFTALKCKKFIGYNLPQQQVVHLGSVIWPFKFKQIDVDYYGSFYVMAIIMTGKDMHA